MAFGTSVIILMNLKFKMEKTEHLFAFYSNDEKQYVIVIMIMMTICFFGGLGEPNGCLQTLSSQTHSYNLIRI